MADPRRPLIIVTGDPAEICDPATGVCELPESSAQPETTISELR